MCTTLRALTSSKSLLCGICPTATNERSAAALDSRPEGSPVPSEPKPPKLSPNRSRNDYDLSMSGLLRRLRGSDSDPCLYVFPFAIHSIMARFTISLAMRGKSRPSRELARLRYQLVNLHRNENLSESYLVNLNAAGGVPALTAKSLPSPLTDSLSISYWLHNTLENNNPSPEVEDLLARGDLSPSHRRALEHKRDCQRKGRQLESRNDSGHRMTDQTRSLLSDVLQQHAKFNNGGMWIFGDEIGPTVLDAHIASFIARLIDLDLVDLVPEQLVPYAKAIVKLPAWSEVMKGYPTVWDPFLGPVEELQI